MSRSPGSAPSLSWLDPATLAAALAKAGVEPGEPASPAPRDLQRAARVEPPLGLRLLIEPAGEPAAREEFSPPGGNLEDRLAALLDWVALKTDSRSIFVFDEEGLVLLERGSDPALAAISSSFINFHERIRSSLGARGQGSITTDLEAGQILHLLQVATGLGRYTLAFIAAEPVPRLWIRRFQTALSRALEGA